MTSPEELGGQEDTADGATAPDGPTVGAADADADAARARGEAVPDAGGTDAGQVDDDGVPVGRADADADAAAAGADPRRT